MNSIENDESDLSRSDALSKCSDLKGPKMYSLIPDLITGWKPKNIKIPSPIILKYKSPLTAQLLDYYEDEIHKIVYIGTIVVIQAPGTLILWCSTSIFLTNTFSNLASLPRTFRSIFKNSFPLKSKLPTGVDILMEWTQISNDLISPLIVISRVETSI